MYNYLNTSTLYIDPINGDDIECNGYAPTSDGHGSGPVKTFERAIWLIRRLRSAGIGYPITIKLTDDIYLDHPILFSSVVDDSQISRETGLGCVTVTSYKKRRRVIGGMKITGWHEDSFNGVRCLSAEVDRKMLGGRYFTDLYVNGAPASVTHYPESGTLKALAVDESSYSVVKRELDGYAKYIIVNKADLEGINGIEDATVSYCHYWIDEHTPVKSYDRETGKLVFKYRSRFRATVQYEPSATSDVHYVLENIPDRFKNSGEWYLDRNACKVYYIPRDESEQADSIEVFAPLTDKLFVVKGDSEHKISDIRFKDLELLCTKGDYASASCSVSDEDFWAQCDDNKDEQYFASDIQSVCGAHGSVVFEHAENCRVENCAMQAIGVHAIEIKCGCHGIRVEGSSFEDIGAGGVKIFGGESGVDKNLETYGNTIRNNRFLRLGLRYNAACGILVCHSYENEISDNEIGYLGYTGISVGWVWGYRPSNTHHNIIRGNHIHHVGVGKLSDMGGIYTLGIQHGTIVENNIIHDVKSSHYGGWGIYPDEGSSFISIEGNTVYETKCEPFHMHFGMYNSVRDNTFAGSNGIVRLSMHEDHPMAVFEDNLYLANGTPVYTQGDAKYFSQGLETSNNRICDTTGREPVLFVDGDKHEYSLEQWQSIFGRDHQSTLADEDEVSAALESIRNS